MGQHETAIAFLTDLEEKLEVAQVQLEMFSTLLPLADDSGEDGTKVKMLGKRLFSITDVRLSFPTRGNFALTITIALPSVCGTF